MITIFLPEDYCLNAADACDRLYIFMYVRQVFEVYQVYLEIVGYFWTYTVSSKKTRATCYLKLLLIGVA